MKGKHNTHNNPLQYRLAVFNILLSNGMLCVTAKAMTSKAKLSVT